MWSASRIITSNPLLTLPLKIVTQSIYISGYSSTSSTRASFSEWTNASVGASSGQDCTSLPGPFSLDESMLNSDFEIIPGQLMTVKVIYDETNQFESFD